MSKSGAVGLDEQEAMRLFETGATLIINDMPLNSEFGIDYKCWRIGESFRGVKMIPPGIHFIYYSVSDRHGSLGMRNGFFHEFKSKDVLVRTWNRQDECMMPSELTPEQVDNFQHRKREMDRHLGAYPYEEYQRWLTLTSYIKPQLLAALVPECGIISSEACLVGEKFVGSRSQPEVGAKLTPGHFQTPKSLEDAERKLPKMSETDESRIRFTKPDTANFPHGSRPSEITHHSLDLSYKLELFLKLQSSRLAADEINFENFLGELQFTFVCFFVGNVYDAFEHWKFMTNLACNSGDAIEHFASMYVKLIGVYYFQLNEMPLDFFTDITTSDNFLVYNLHNLFDNIKEMKEGESAKRLKDRAEQFKGYLKEKFEFDFDEELDEYAPVVCDENDLHIN